MAQDLKKIDLIFGLETLTIPINPNKSKLPSPQKRRVGDKAFLEDGIIEFSNDYCPSEFLDQLQKFYETYSMPFIINDYFGRSFLVCFEEFDRPQQADYEGYRLVLSIQIIY